MAGEVILELWDERDSVSAELQRDPRSGKELPGILQDGVWRGAAALCELHHTDPHARPQLEQATAQRDLHIEVGRKDLGAVSHVWASRRAAIIDPAQADASTVGVPHPVTTDHTDL